MSNISTTLEKIDTIAIGGFDGMHKAHQQLLKHLGNNGAVLVIDAGYANLTPKLERKRHCKKEIIFFDLQEIRSLSAKEFLDKLKNKFVNLKKIVVGYDFRFAKNRSANSNDLKLLYNGEVVVVDEYKHNNISVHARTIRDLIKSGKIKEANALLGYKYTIQATIIAGQGLGKKELYPTLNLAKNPFLKPQEGVYAALVQLDNELDYRPAVVFTGDRKTTDNSYALEVHVLDAEIQNIQHVRIHFIDFIRENRTFKHLASLKEAIMQDIAKARDLTRTMS